MLGLFSKPIGDIKMQDICPITGLDCNRLCRQWDNRQGCKLSKIRVLAFKEKPYADLVNKVIELTTPGQKT